MTPQQREHFFSEFDPAVAKMPDRERQAMEALMVVFLRDHPFFAYFMMDRMDVVWTHDVPTAATDGVANIYINPTYFAALSIDQRVFGVAHEILHGMLEHLPRDKVYEFLGLLNGSPYNFNHANMSQDAVINEMLIRDNIGAFKHGWVRDPAILPEETYEDVYKRTYAKQPPGQGGQGKGGQGGQQGGGRPKPGSGRPQTQPGTSPFQGSGFDEHLPPPIDKKTGKPVAPDTQGIKQTVIQAAAHAKSMGKMPVGIGRFVEALKEPQVDWQDHLAFRLSTLVGTGELSMARRNRRRLAVSIDGYQQVWPGKTGKGSGVIVLVGDTSGSMGEPELQLIGGETCGIIESCHPKQIFLTWCDAKVHRIDEIVTLDELEEALAKGMPGGGGTDFRPPFEEVEKLGIQPAAMVFVTDGIGPFPKEAPSYPVFWVMTTNKKAPFGETLRVKV